MWVWPNLFTKVFVVSHGTIIPCDPIAVFFFFKVVHAVLLVQSGAISTHSHEWAEITLHLDRM